jgi:hypothetical protein
VIATGTPARILRGDLGGPPELAAEQHQHVPVHPLRENVFDQSREGLIEAGKTLLQRPEDVAIDGMVVPVAGPAGLRPEAIVGLTLDESHSRLDQPSTGQEALPQVGLAVTPPDRHRLRREIERLPQSPAGDDLQGLAAKGIRGVERPAAVQVGGEPVQCGQEVATARHRQHAVGGQSQRFHRLGGLRRHKDGDWVIGVRPAGGDGVGAGHEGFVGRSQIGRPGTIERRVGDERRHPPRASRGVLRDDRANVGVFAPREIGSD